MKILRHFCFWLLAVSLTTVTLNAQSGARLTGRSGTVEILRNNQWLQLIPGEAVNAGEKIRTAADSSASIEFGSGQVVTLSSNSEIQITDQNRRVYVADGRRLLPHDAGVCPTYYFAPYVSFGNAGVQTQPVPTYPSGQIVPPMTDPLRPPVHYPANPFPVR